MKFAHALKEALVQDGYPEPWVAAAVPYSQLKKCLKKVSMLVLKPILTSNSSFSRAQMASKSLSCLDMYGRCYHAISMGVRMGIQGYVVLAKNPPSGQFILSP